MDLIRFVREGTLIFSLFAIAAMLPAFDADAMPIADSSYVRRTIDETFPSQDAADPMRFGLQNAYRQYVPSTADWLARSIEKIDYSLLQMQLKESRKEIKDLRQKVERLEKSPRR